MTRRTDATIEKMLKTADNKPTGMTLVTASTGKGKTYSLIGYAIEALNNDRYDTVIFVEPRHAILEDVNEKILARSGEEPLYLASTVNNAKEYIDSVALGSVKDKTLKGKLEDLSELLGALDGAKGKQKEAIEDAVRKAKTDIKAYCTTAKEKLCVEDLIEVAKIYPEKVRKNTHFILMTMDKLFHALDTLDKENRILSKRLFSERTLVVIDELDKCYAIALNKCAENKDNLEDMLSIIQTAYKFVSSDDTRWKQFNDPDTNAMIQSKRESLAKDIETMNQKYGILNNFIFDAGENEKIELFVSKSQSYVASRNSHYRLDIKDKTTTLKKSSYDTGFSVVKMAIDLKDTVRKIFNLIYDLSEGYMNDRSDATYEEGLLFGISQVFNRTDADSGRYLNYARSNTIKTQALRIAKGEFIKEKSVCNNGFSHVVFENRPGTNHTYVTSYGIDLTPENIFAWLAKNANVICLSATQQIHTALSLDLDYMKEVLGASFDCYCREDFDRANSKIEIKTQNLYCDVIHSFGEDRTKLYSAIVDLFEKEGIDVPERFKKAVYDVVDDIHRFSNGMIDRDYKRFFAICNFLFRRNAVSGITILNSGYDTLKSLRNFVTTLANQYGIGTMDPMNIYCINADNMEYGIKDIKDKLNRGIKCLIISNKEALGQGVNIQYDRDFNFFYQEDPTHIFPQIKTGEPLPKEEINRYVYLVMKMASSGEISSSTMKTWISNIVAAIPSEFKKYSSVKNAKTSIFIQGLGRANRNADKESHEYIFFDEELCDVLDLENIQVEKTQELVAVEDCIKRYKEEELSVIRESMNNKEKQLCDNSNAFQKLVHDLLSTFTKENMMSDRVEAFKEYEAIRQVLVKYGPFPAKIQPADEEVFKQLGYAWVEAPKNLFYRSKDDNYCENLLSVSFSKLNKMKQLDFNSVLRLKDYEVPKGGCWMINPKAFNVLQGAVAEYRFKSLFEDETGYELEELPLEDNEICGDFRVKDTDVYIDVKNFLEEAGTRDITDFALDKLEMIREKNPDGKLIVVNVFAKERYNHANSNHEDILVISNVLGENNIKYRENLKIIEQWIDSNT